MDPDSYLSQFLDTVSFSAPSLGGIVALVFALFFLLLSGFVSASEIAFFSLSSDELQSLDDENPRDRLIKTLLGKAEQLLATILITNNLVNVSVVMLLNFFFSGVIDFGGSAVFDFIFQSVILTFLLLLFGEVVPKFYANQDSLRWARFACNGLNVLQGMFAPMARFMVRSTHRLNKHFSHRNVNLSVDELSQALELTQVEAHEEKEMLEGIIHFGGKTVAEIMTARVDITDVEVHTSFRGLLDIVIQSGYSRLPVYDGREDNIKGIIYSKDLLPYRNETDDFEWQKLLRRAYFVPEAKMIDDLLEEFRTKKIHMAVVVDEFGGTSGIVTMEDILEEIVGDINDEYDEEEKQYIRLSDGSFIFDGKILLSDFYKVTGLEEKAFNDRVDDVETLAGLILAIKEDFPREKEHVRFASCDFLILEVEKRRIVKVKLTVKPENILAE